MFVSTQHSSQSFNMTMLLFDYPFRHIKTCSYFVCQGKCVKYQKRPALPSASDSSFHKQSTNNRRNGSTAMPSQKPLRDRIIHLLALKPYRKPELLLWLERERAGPKDKAELGAVLEEVPRNKKHAAVSPTAQNVMYKCTLYWGMCSQERHQ